MTAATALRTLVLNADYLPISTWPLSLIPAQEAISAVCRGRAVVVDEWDAVFRSPSQEIRVPKVMALKAYAHVTATPKFCRRSIFLRDGYHCQYRGEQFPTEELTFDHLIPRSAGGQTEWANILTACINCNGAKRATMPNFSGRRSWKGGQPDFRPLKLPRQPTSAELLRAGLKFLGPEIWETYADWLYWSAEYCDIDWGRTDLTNCRLTNQSSGGRPSLQSTRRQLDRVVSPPGAHVACLIWPKATVDLPGGRGP
jgi:5-methylcytosine-specific restriction endonuclease McrA